MFVCCSRISFGCCGRFTAAELLSFSLSVMLVLIWVLTGHWLLMDGEYVNEGSHCCFVPLLAHGLSGVDGWNLLRLMWDRLPEEALPGTCQECLEHLFFWFGKASREAPEHSWKVFCTCVVEDEWPDWVKDVWRQWLFVIHSLILKIWLIFGVHLVVHWLWCWNNLLWGSSEWLVGFDLCSACLVWWDGWNWQSASWLEGVIYWFFFVVVDLNSQLTVPKRSLHPSLLPSRSLVLSLALS